MSADPEDVGGEVAVPLDEFEAKNNETKEDKSFEMVDRALAEEALEHDEASKDQRSLSLLQRGKAYFKRKWSTGNSLMRRRPSKSISSHHSDKVVLYSGYSTIFYMPTDNAFRHVCIKIVSHKVFDPFILVLILFNTITLALDNPLDGPSTKRDVLDVMEIGFLALFTVEMVLKVIARGFVLHEHAYLRDHWNKADFLIVLVGYIGFLPGMQGKYAVVRLVRVLRPLRSANFLPGVRILVHGIFRSFSMMTDNLVLLTFCFALFGIAGLHIFGGAFRQQCVSASSGVVDIDRDYRCRIGTDDGPFSCDVRSSCLPLGPNPNFGVTNYDTIFYSWLTTLTVISLEGWTDVVYFTWETTNYWSTIYFIAVIVVVAFFVKELITGVIYSGYMQCVQEEEQKMRALKAKHDFIKGNSRSGQVSASGRQFLGDLGAADRGVTSKRRVGQALAGNFIRDSSTSTQGPTERKPSSNNQIPSESQEKQPGEVKEHSVYVPYPRLPAGMLSRAEFAIWHPQGHMNCLFHWFVVAQHDYFQRFIMVVILLNTLLLASEHQGQPDVWTDFLLISNYVITGIFVLEVAIKMVGFGLKGYIMDNWNRFDLIIVVVSLVELVTLAVGGEEAGISSLRTLRLLRVFKLARGWPELRKLLLALLDSMKSLTYFFVLLTLFVFLYAMIGVQLFAGKLVTDGESSRGNFDTLGWALVQVFQIITGENWNELLYDAVDDVGMLSAIYYCSLFVVGNFIIINLFLAILLSNFEHDDGGKDKENDKQSASSRPSSTQLLPRGISSESHSQFQRSDVTRLASDKRALLRERSAPDVMVGPVPNPPAPPAEGGDEDDNVPEDAGEKGEGDSGQANEVIDAKDHDAGVKNPALSAFTVVRDSSNLSHNVPVTGALAPRKIKNPSRLSFANPNIVRNLPTADDSDSDSTSRVNTIRSRRASIDAEEILAALLKKKPQQLSGMSMFCFSPENALRLKVRDLTNHKYFEGFILSVIFISAIFLVLDTPGHTFGSGFDDFMTVWNWLSTMIFVLEFLLKAVAQGFLFTEFSYLKDGWNVLDFIIVIFSILDLALSGTKFLKSFRVFRALRPLRLVTHFPQLQLVVGSMLSAGPQLLNVTLVASLFMICFAIFGMNLFGGKFRWCEHIGTGEALYGVDKAECRRRYESQGYAWVNPPAGHFDHVGAALVILFEVATMEMWPDVLYRAVDTTLPDEAPVRDNKQYYALFFILFLATINFLVLNLFIGVVVERFQEMMRAVNEKTQVESFERANRLFEVVKYESPAQGSRFFSLRQWMFDVVGHVVFERVVIVVIILNTIALMLWYYGVSDGYQLGLDIAGYTFSVLFIMEAVMKLLAWGPKQYFSASWNRLDFLIVVLSILEVVLVFAAGVNSFNPTLFRLFRLFKIVEISDQLETLRNLIVTIIISMPALASVSILLCLIFFMYAVAGMQLFYNIRHGDFINVHANFNSFGITLFTLFRMATGESWNGLMHDCFPVEDVLICDPDDDDPETNCGTWLALPYFISFVVIGQFLVLNLVIAIVLGQFETLDAKVKQDLEEKERREGDEINSMSLLASRKRTDSKSKSHMELDPIGEDGEISLSSRAERPVAGAAAEAEKGNEVAEEVANSSDQPASGNNEVPLEEGEQRDSLPPL